MGQSTSIRTPLLRLRLGGAYLADDVEVYLKPENLQPLGSFKVRPATHALASLPATTQLREAGVCTASAGNFAQGLAWCCRERGIHCTVVAPNSAPRTKLAAIERLGAEVICVPYSEWWSVIQSRHCPQVGEAVTLSGRGQGKASPFGKSLDLLITDASLERLFVVTDVCRRHHQVPTSFILEPRARFSLGMQPLLWKLWRIYPR